MAEIRRLNPHLVPDIAVTYVVAGAALVRFAMRQTGRPSGRRFWHSRGAPSVVLRGQTGARGPTAGRRRYRCPPTATGAVVAFALCTISTTEKSDDQMVLRRWIDKFECTWSYDASYLRDVLDADPRALLALS